MRTLGGRGVACPALADLAALAGVPAKRLGEHAVDGGNVADLWLDGRAEDIRRYNECDALTTYLLWTRAVRLAGLWSEEEAAAEEGAVEQLLERRDGAENAHLRVFLERWRTVGSPLMRDLGADTHVR